MPRSLWVRLDMLLADKPSGQVDDWFSFATFSPDTSDGWNRTVGVNIVHSGYVHLMHVPRQGMGEYLYQASAANDPGGDRHFPMGEWVRLDIYIDLDSAHGEARVWQNGVLVSRARVEGGNGTLAQAHFGLYAGAAVASGTIWNDHLRIQEVADLDEAENLVAADW